MTNVIDRAKSIFLSALEIAQHDRIAYVEALCGDNQPLSREVVALLDHAQRLGGFLASNAEIDQATIDEPRTETIGTQIGPYKLLEQIGEGGMGSVYVAEQKEPVRRKVALKLIKPGMDTQQVVTRFEAERQALAMMNHPNIAKVLDAGATDAGRPYFVMELVKGVTITEFCDQHKLDVRKRLQLFITLCQAVQHAHQKGVIHRDLKPSNVLVEMHDTMPVPKVIDFGVAKAIGQQLSDRTLHTGFGQMIGTPLYMSPEQAGQSSIDVDTRSDVYSLGVLLYELLTGTTPFDKETLSKAGFDEMRRMIREDDPPRPSARVSTHQTKAQSTLSQQHKTDSQRPSTELPILPTRKPTMHLMYLFSLRQGSDPSHMSATLRGELDWIVMKALEKDRSRRYESASALANDVQRYLSDEPVLACPPSTVYRFQKFARKHRTAFAASVAIAVSLIFGTTVSAWQAVRATTAEAQANANETQAKEAAAAEAQQRQRAEANEQKANANANQAQASAQEAKDQAQVAATQRDEAQKQRDEVKALADRLQRTLYVSNMNLAQHTWEACGAERVRDLLEQHRPKAGEADLRGFEWRYLYRLTHAQVLTLQDAGNVSYSPDGKHLVTIAIGPPDSAKVLKVWDSRTGQQLYALNGVINHSISSDSGRMAGAVRDPMTRKFALKVWDLQSGQELLSIDYLAGDNPPPYLTVSATISPDGKRLASTSSNETVKVWDAETGRELLSLKGHKSTVTNVVFSPDGKRLASCNSNTDGGQVKLLNSQTGEELLAFKGRGVAPGSIVFSPDSNRLASRDGNQVKIWDANSGQELFNLQGHSDRVENIVFSPESKRLASASDDQTVKVWDTETGRDLLTLEGHTGEGHSVAFSPDGKRLVSRDGQNLKFWDALTGQKLRIIEDGGFSNYTNNKSVSFSPDGKRLACTYRGGLVKVWDAQQDQTPLTLKSGVTNGNQNATLAFSPDGKRLAGTAKDFTAKLWDAKTGQELLTLKGHGHKDGWHADEFQSLAFSPNGKRIVAGGIGPKGFGQPGELKVWDAESGQELLAFQGHTCHVYRLAFSPDGKRLASGGGNWWGKAGPPEVKVWDAESGQELLSLKGHSSGIRSVAYSPDGKRLASGSSDETVKIWDAQTGEELLTLRGHTNQVHDVAFSSDGKRLASASADKTVKVWDSQTGQELLTLKGHTGRVGSVAFSPSGYQLATASWDGTIKIWDATPLPEKP